MRMFLERCTCHQENQPLYDFAALTAQSLFFRNLFSILHQSSVIVQLVRLKPGRNPKEKMLIKKLLRYILPAGIHSGNILDYLPCFTLHWHTWNFGTRNFTVVTETQHTQLRIPFCVMLKKGSSYGSIHMIHRDRGK